MDKETVKDIIWTLVRSNTSKDGVFGEMTCNRSNLTVAVLEHAFPTSTGFSAKVALGSYKCVRYDSPDHGYQVFVLEGVPKFQGNAVSYIELHIGNFNKDSDGCILLGATAFGNMITDSKKTFNEFMDVMKDVTSFTLIIEEKI